MVFIIKQFLNLKITSKNIRIEFFFESFSNQNKFWFLNYVHILMDLIESNYCFHLEKLNLPCLYQKKSVKNRMKLKKTIKLKTDL